MELGIHGKLAVVTGADGDIGGATALELADNGVRLVISGKKRRELHELGEQLPADQVEASVVADVTAPEDIARIAQVADQYSGADIMVHAAGITGAKGDPLEFSDAQWNSAWDVDFMSAVRIAKAIIPGMVRRGWGRVVYVASENAVQPYGDEMPYNVAKAALLNFAKGVGQVYAPRGVLVNAVSPAFIASGMTDRMMEQRAEERGESFEETVQSFLDEERPHLVLHRRGDPAEVASVIAFLCSERASFVVGSTYRVDGGSVLAVST